MYYVMQLSATCGTHTFASKYHGLNGKRGQKNSHCDYLYVQFSLLWCTLTYSAADVKSLHLPEITKSGFLGFRRTPRRLYAVLSIEDCPNIPYVMSSLDPEVYMTRPMTLWAVSSTNRIRLTPSSLSKPSADLNIKLFAKRNHHDDILLAQTQVQVDAFDGDPDYEGLSWQ